MDVRKLSRNQDGSPKPTFKEAMDGIKEGRPIEPSLAKTIAEMTSGHGAAMAAFREMNKPIKLPEIKPIPRPLSKNDMAELMSQQEAKVKRMELWTAAGVIVAILALIVAVLTMILK